MGKTNTATLANPSAKKRGAPAELSHRLHIELERSANIPGDYRQKQERISDIWDFVRDAPHFRAPFHIPRSSNDLVVSTKIDLPMSEVKEVRGPARHKFLLDTVALDLRQARVVFRLEKRQKREEGALTETFTAVVKIGNKEDKRPEETVEIDIDTLLNKGFWAAFEKGMEAENRVKQCKKLKKKIDCALGEGRSLSALQVFPLVHLQSDTRKALYSPQSNSELLVELKTDNLASETFLGSVHYLGQVELEFKAGSLSGVALDRELSIFTHQFAYLEETSESKADAPMGDLEQYLIFQDVSAEEQRRVEFNRRAVLEWFSQHKNPIQFNQTTPEDLCLQLPVLAVA